MTKIEIKYQVDNVEEIVAKGHSNFAPFGTDIVCAGISTLLQTAVLSIKTMFNYDIAEILKEGLIVLKLPSDAQVQIVIKAILIGLKDIATDYPKNINIKEIKDVY